MSSIRKSMETERKLMVAWDWGWVWRKVEWLPVGMGFPFKVIKMF